MKNDKVLELTTTMQMNNFLNSTYFKEFQRQQAKQTEECRFRPNLKLTQGFNEQNLNQTQNSEDFFNRSMKWRNQSKDKLELLRKASEDSQLKNATFKPEIKQMISERQYKEIKNAEKEVALSISVLKNMMIPEDNTESRQTFKTVPGMAKFLEKQYAAMCDKEEIALMNYNLGKTKDQQKTIEEWINPTFAYADTSPRGISSFAARRTRLNPNLSGTRSSSRLRG